MVHRTLADFVARTLARRRISYGDLRRLERDILPGGPTCREDVEALVGLGHAVTRADPEWPAYLAGAVREFVVGPGGIVDRETAEWLLGGPLRDRSRTGLAIARAIVLDAREVDPALAAYLEGPRRVRAPRQEGEAMSPMADGALHDDEPARETERSVAGTSYPNQERAAITGAVPVPCTEGARL